ncbi:hypothetical protein [Actinoallomurus sp. NPDC052274]|uniref:hypothetical protein n=1 Tax=Actinoallomurus sp. NPDC052274 TaxID=3155420 RepID=UPI003437BE00
MADNHSKQTGGSAREFTTERDETHTGGAARERTADRTSGTDTGRSSDHNTLER